MKFSVFLALTVVVAAHQHPADSKFLSLTSEDDGDEVLETGTSEAINKVIDDTDKEQSLAEDKQESSSDGAAQSTLSEITDKCFFDVEIDGQKQERIVMGLYGKVVPKTA